MGNGESAISDLPHDITFDRCYIHSDPAVGGRRGIALNGVRAAVIDSYVAGFKENGADTQAIHAANTTGPLKIVNNYLEAAGENFMTGGADINLPSPNQPTDIEIKHNYFFKPLSWKGQGWVIKNLLEFKVGQRILVEGNILENNWGGEGQNGFSFLITPRGQGTTNPWNVTDDITFRYNKMINVGSGVNIFGGEGDVTGTHRVLIQNSVLEIAASGMDADSRGLMWLGGSTVDGQIGSPFDAAVDHVTILGCTGALAFSDHSPIHRMSFTNNIGCNGDVGFSGTGYGPGTSTLNGIFDSDWTFTQNAIIGGSGTYPANTYFPGNVAAVGFVDYANGNYRLSASSPYKNLGTDGKDLGADFGALEAATLNTISGQWGTGGSSTPPNTPHGLRVR